MDMEEANKQKDKKKKKKKKKKIIALQTDRSEAQNKFSSQKLEYQMRIFVVSNVT
jgi:hypothetical protein